MNNTTFINFFKKPFVAFPLLIMTGTAFFYYLKKDLGLTLLLGTSLLLTFIAVYFLWKKEEEDVAKYDAISNLTKNCLEMVAILLVGLTTYQSAWFEDFFYHQEVDIKGSLYEQRTGQNFPIYEQLRFKCALLSEDEDKRSISFSFNAKDGEIKENIKLNKSYQKAVFTIMGQQYGFYDIDSLGCIDITFTYKSVIPFDNILVFDPILYKLPPKASEIAETTSTSAPRENDSR